MSQNTHRRKIVYSLFAVVIFLGIYLLIVHPTWRTFLIQLISFQTISQVREYVYSLGMWGPTALIGLMILHSVTFVPAEVITLSSLILYGPFWGLLYAWVGSMLGAYFSFYLAKGLGRPLVIRYVPPHKLETFDTFMRNKGVKGLFILRLIPLVSFNALNYACGLTDITLWQFTWTTGLGILPAEIIMAFLYQGVIHTKYSFVLLGIVSVIVAIAMLWKAKTLRKDKLS